MFVHTPMRHYTYHIKRTQTDTKVRRSDIQTHDPRQAYEYSSTLVAEHVLIDMYKISEQIDYGNMLIFLNQHRAFVRLLEHCDFIAREPAQDLSQLTEEDCTFYDDSGTPFQVLPRDTIPRQKALKALWYWIQYDKDWPELTWE